MNEDQKLKGWKLLLYSLFIGPLFMLLYFQETRKVYPAARYFAWLTLIIMAGCAYLQFTFMFSPSIVGVVYCALFLSIFGLTFMYCWVLDSKNMKQQVGPKHEYSISRAVAWMLVMGILFYCHNNIVQAINYWVLGEQITVYFSAQANLFNFWIVIGLIYGFFYGMRQNNDYFNRDLRSVAKSIFFAFLFVYMFSGLILLLVTYPLQRLAPISYRPQSADFIFYVLLFVAISFSAVYLIRTAHRFGFLKMSAMFIVGILFISLHVIVVSSYSTTINLAIASILEDRRELSSAKTLYAKSIPYIRYDHLLASLHHRQGVLHVLNQDYSSALASFKKVLADYSENYDVYQKAFKYVESFEKNKFSEKQGRKILLVKHRTFEQAASCFPNSLSVILNFYEEQPISTRKVSYAIKETFSSGTFIWKAESFLSENGYNLLTTFWQDKEMLMSLLEEDYPVLVYVPGHVYTLYGYDSRMEMFLTYDTARLNRWNDKPFRNLQRDWMKGSFLMSVVIRKGEESNFKTLFPQLYCNSETHSLWQKAKISNYYEQKDNYWKDYDRYNLSKSIGLDRLIIGDNYFLSEDFYPLPWNSKKWNGEVLPVLNHPWATEWLVAERCFQYLIYSGKSEQAFELIRQYQARISDEAEFIFPRLLELKLSAALDAGMEQEVLSISEKLIGITGNREYETYWGQYFKARRLIVAGDLKGAVELLLPALKNIYISEDKHPLSLKCILDAINEICQIDPTLIDPEKKSLVEIARIYFASDQDSRPDPAFFAR